MELRSQAKVSGSSAKPRVTSLGRGIAADRESDYYDANVTSLVGLPSSPITTTGDGKLASHTHPVQGGQARTSIPSARSESEGGAVGSPEGSPLRRQGKTRELGDAGEAATRVRRSPAAEALGGVPSVGRDEGLNLTLVSKVESPTRGSDLSPPTSARRESADNDVSLSKMPTSGADLQTHYVETHTNVTDLTSTKQSAPGPFKAARADIAQTKDRRIDLKVYSAVQSTYLQRGVTVSSQLRQTETQMAPHRTSEKGPHSFGSYGSIRGVTFLQHLHGLPFRCSRLTCIASYRIGLRFPQRRF